MKFGTDGVRGVANTELTAEFSLRLGRAAARVLGRWRRTTVVRRWRHPGVDADARRRAVGRVRGRRRRRGPARRGADADGRLRGAASRSDGGDGLRLAQPVPRQRHQAVRRRRDQAVRRRRIGDRARTRTARSRPSANRASVARRSTSRTRRGLRRPRVLASLRGRRRLRLRIVVDAANGAAHRLGRTCSRASAPRSS